MNVIGYSNDETNFLHKLLLNGTQVSTPRKTFGNNSSTNIKLSKTPLSKMVKLWQFIELFKLMNEPLVKVGELVKKVRS